MRNKTQSISRLRRLAHHLRTGRLGQDYSTMEVYSFEFVTSLIFLNSRFYTFAPFVLEEMPEIFPNDWSRNWNGKTICHSSPHTNIHYAVAEYFGLTVEEAQHCFQLEAQFPEIYRGGHLTKRTFNIKNVVKNINGLIKTAIQMDLYDKKLIFREVLIEKCARISPSDWLKTQNLPK